MLEFHVSGIPEFDDALDEMNLRIVEACRKIVQDGALLVATEAKKGFRPYPGGRTVSKNKPWNPRFQSHIGRVYYSFAPPFQAQPPMPTNRSQMLKNSIGHVFKVMMTDNWGWMGIVGTDRKYAAYVEYGTSRMKPEPFMSKALDDNRGKLEELATEKWAKAMEA